MRFIFLNGPPRSGKDSAALALRAAIPGSLIVGFSWHLKIMVHTIYLGREGAALDPNHFDAIKDEPQAILDGASWRQSYIYYSEKVIKSLHGTRWFGQQLLNVAHRSGSSTIIVPDSGFVPEAEVIIEEVGADKVTLAHFHRPGRTYAGDSRTYIDLTPHGILGINLRNDGTLEEWNEKCLRLV